MPSASPVSRVPAGGSTGRSPGRASVGEAVRVAGADRHGRRCSAGLVGHARQDTPRRASATPSTAIRRARHRSPCDLRHVRDPSLVLTWLGVVACGSVLVAAASATSLTPQRDGLLALEPDPRAVPVRWPLRSCFLPWPGPRDPVSATARSGRCWSCRGRVRRSGSCPARWRCRARRDPRIDAAIGVTSWNLELGAAGSPGGGGRHSGPPMPALVGLEELTPRHAEAIAADPAIRARFPYQVARAPGRLHGHADC